MNILLIFPPVSDPRGPHLGPACITASLRKAGHSVTVRDLDLETTLLLLTPAELNRHVRMAEQRLEKLADDDKHSNWETLAWRQKLFQHLEDARAHIHRTDAYVETLRTASFYTPSNYYQARKGIDTCLSFVAACHDFRLSYKIDGQVFSTRYNEAFLSELLEAVDDTDYTLFSQLYSTRILPEIISDAPDITGISILNHQQIIPGLTIARLLKKAGLTVVIGGTLFSKFTDFLSSCKAFSHFCDGIIAYEGDTAMVALADAVKNNGLNDLSRVPNLIWFNGKTVVANTPFFAEELTALPTPDFDGFPLTSYLAPATVLPFNLGKGCYWNRCFFCEIPLINNCAGGSSYRIKPAKLIVDQLEELSSRFKTPYFQFTDESCSPALLEEIADETLKRNLKIYYLCYARMEKGFTAGLLEKLKQAGLRRLMFGLESGSDRMLKFINKGISSNQAKQVLQNCFDAGVYFKLFTIIGFPDETLEDALETRRFLRQSSPLLKHPLNSFEINLFHLDRFSSFGRNTGRFNISLQQKQQGEFYLGGDRFDHPRRMDRKTLHSLIKQMRQEMYGLACMEKKHSSWEEYALLNICHQTP